MEMFIFIAGVQRLRKARPCIEPVAMEQRGVEATVGKHSP